MPTRFELQEENPRAFSFHQLRLIWFTSTPIAHCGSFCSPRARRWSASTRAGRMLSASQFRGLTCRKCCFMSVRHSRGGKVILLPNANLETQQGIQVGSIHSDWNSSVLSFADLRNYFDTYQFERCQFWTQSDQSRKERGDNDSRETRVLSKLCDRG